jgi:hypothetical protein
MTNRPEDEQRQPPNLTADAHALLDAASAHNSADVPPVELPPFEPTPAAPAGTEPAFGQYAPSSAEPQLFQSLAQPPIRPPVRIPHFGHLVFLLLVLMPFGILATGVFMALAIHARLFGVSTTQKAMNDIHYMLGSEGVLYLCTFALCLLIFPFFWHKGLLAGLQWNGATALRLRWRLVSAAGLCFLLALLNGELMPGPTNAPIEKIFQAPGAAWLLFAFGVTFAPFFEEMFFRGFLLPALCTAADWITEKVNADSPFSVDANGRPKWPARAVTTTAFFFTSMPAAILLAGFARGGHIAGRILVTYFAGVSVFLLYLANRTTRARELARPIGLNGHPLWSIPSMVIASVLTSIPFAWMHAQQTGYSIGPLLLLVGVSLVLCAVRLATCSLAASVVVHACYNFLLFSVMLIFTGGFRHFDKM